MEEEERKEREQKMQKEGAMGATPIPQQHSTSLLWPTDNIWGFANPAGTTAQPNPYNHLWSPSVHTNAQLQQHPSSSAIGIQLPDRGLLFNPQSFVSGSPGTSERLVHALESPVAFIEGDPSRQEDLELYYYRFSGSTAIHPGINRISLKLQPRSVTVQSSASAPVPSSSRSSSRASTVSPEDPYSGPIFDPSGLPLPHIHLPLLATFFRTMSQHFPSISQRRMKERLETGTMSAFLLNCICAVSARFHSPGNENPAKACAPFITKAQELIIPLLHLPTTDVVTGLLLLAWANYGQNSESGLWQYSGMAFRMAADLGIHEVSEIYETAAHVVRTRLLFWSLFVTDRILSFSTGRPPSIHEEMVEIPLPSDEDFFPDPARTDDPTAAAEPVQPVPYTYLVRLMVLCGRIASVLNGRRGRPRTLVGFPSGVAPELSGIKNEGGAAVQCGLKELQTSLVQFYAGLPDSLKWSVEAFKVQESRGHGGTFLTLHLWANAVMAMTYHPELTTSPSGMETPLSSGMDRSVKLSLASSRTISECLVFADLFGSSSYLGSPFVVQPIYVASLAFINDMKHSALGYNQQAEEANTGNTVDMLLSTLAKQNLSVLFKATQAMEHYWAGIAYVSNILEQRASGLGYLRIDPSPKAKKAFISLPDMGLLRRFTGRNLPHNTAPPTETSLRESMANGMYSLDELLSSYSVEGMFVQPADSLDLQSLLSSGSNGESHQYRDPGFMPTPVNSGMQPSPP